MTKSKILEASLGHLVVALSEETVRFVSNKQPIHSLAPAVLCDAMDDCAAVSEG